MAAGPNGSPGINKMCQVISQRAAKVAGKADRDLVLDFASVQGDMSILTNTFPIPIPKGEYHVCRHINGFKYKADIGESGKGTHGGHYGGDGRHEHLIKPPKIKPGDRVLVAWIQNELVVIDVIDTTE